MKGYGVRMCESKHCMVSLKRWDTGVGGHEGIGCWRWGVACLEGMHMRWGGYY